MVLKKISQVIHSIDPNAEVYLFGSRARGTNNSSSDFDILILLNVPKVTDQLENLFRDPLYNLELESGKIISSFIYPKSYWDSVLSHSPFYENISNEGVLL